VVACAHDRGLLKHRRFETWGACHDSCTRREAVTSISIGYRILELPLDSDNFETDGVEIGRYDCAYRAMEEMKREFFRRAADAPNWYLIAPNQQVLLSPDDLLMDMDT
jgi:hypothetical protein